VRVIVVAQLRVAEPRQPHEALTLRQHVRHDARLPGCERVDDEVRLDLRDARVVGEVRDVFRLFEVPAVVGRQARARAFEFAERRQMLVETLTVGLAATAEGSPRSSRTASRTLFLRPIQL
jgi:hypothetical protein